MPSLPALIIRNILTVTITLGHGSWYRIITPVRHERISNHGNMFPLGFQAALNFGDTGFLKHAN